MSLGGPDRAPRCRRCRRAMGCEAWPSSSPISGTVSGGWGAAGPGLDGAGPAAAGGCCASGRGVRPSSDSPVTSPAPFPSPSVAASCSRRSPHEMATRPGGRREMRGGGGCRDRRLFDAGAGVICLCLPSVRCFLLPHGLICWGRAGEGVDAHRWSEAGVGGLVAGRGVHRGSPRPASSCRCSAAPQESSRPLQGRGELGLRWLCLRLA